MNRYIHKDNFDKPYVDWRLPENRIKMCLRSYGWRLKNRDLDHYTYNQCYMDHASMTDEQRIYFSMLFGITYQSSMAWVIWSHFPNIEKIDWKEFEEWNNYGYERQRFAKDTKYNKGKFIPIIKDIHKKVLEKHGSLRAWANTFQNFEHAFSEITTIYRIGRMSGWLATQTFYELCEGMAHIVPKDMLATDPSNWSVRSGLAFLYNRPELMDLDGKRKYTEDDICWIKNAEQRFIKSAGEHVRQEDMYYYTPFTLETHLCQMKKFLAVGGDILGSNPQEAHTTWFKLKALWPNLDWSAFDKIWHYAAPCVQKTFQNKVLMKTGALTGQMINMHDENPDLPDMYKEFGIDPNWLKSIETYRHPEIKTLFSHYVKTIGQNVKNIDNFFVE